MKKIISIVVISVTLFTFIGCEKISEVKEDKNIDNCLSDNNITSVENISEDLKSTISKTIVGNKSLAEIDMENAKVLEYSNSDLIGVVANYTDSQKKSYIAFYDDVKKEIKQDLIVDIEDVEDIKKITFFDTNEIAELELKVNSITGEILDVTKLNADKQMSFSDCLDMAFTSCLNDGECAFLCGIVWQYCVSAIVIACAG